MEEPKFVSFDLDGTLVDRSFVNAVWLDGIPRLHAKKEGISLDAAKSKVKKKYGAVGVKRLEWYDIKYWLRKFHLGSENWRTLFRKYRHLVSTYPEVHEVLQTLRDMGYKLMVVSNAAREFFDAELRETGLASYFKYAFSATSDFQQVKREGLYDKILLTLDVSPSEVIHIGDDWYFDYVMPRKAGIRSFLLDRENQRSGEYVVKDLEEFVFQLSQNLCGR